MASKSNDTMLSLGLLILRVGAGVMLLAGHGWPKLVHFSERAPRFADPLHVGHPASLSLVILAEFVCSILVVLGLWTRFALVPILIFFGVAIFVQGGGKPFDERELAIIYAIPFATLALTGPGRFAVDAAGGSR